MPRWRSLDLPHDWSIEGPFAQNEPSGGPGANAPTGIGWYRKHFRVPAFYKDRKVSIEFDGVYQNSEVWINGHYLGKRPFGYISFAHDITPHLNWNGDNAVAVKVDNSRQPSSRYYSGLGHLPAYLAGRGEPTHVAHWGTFVTTPRVTKEPPRSTPRRACGTRMSASRGVHAGRAPYSIAMARSCGPRKSRRKSAPATNTSSSQELSVEKAEPVECERTLSL